MIEVPTLFLLVILLMFKKSTLIYVKNGALLTNFCGRPYFSKDSPTLPKVDLCRFQSCFEDYRRFPARFGRRLLDQLS